MPPSSSPYRPSEPPDSPLDESDSDLDLDLDELDPTPDSDLPQARKSSGDLGRSRDGGDEDAEALLADDEGRASGPGGDDAPLLSAHGGGRRRRSFANDSLRNLGLRLPSFISGAGGEAGGDDGELDQEEDDPSASRLVA